MKLTHLTDRVLHQNMITLVQRERALLADVLWHLKEVDRRKLYCEYKCGSLFEYCVKVLKYSEGQASRRVTACRLLKELPEISSDIQKGELNLTQLNQAKGYFNEMGISGPEDKKKIIDEIKGKTTKETEEILWEKKENKIPPRMNVSLKKETVDALFKLKALKAHSCPDLDALLMKMVETASKVWDPRTVSRERKIGQGNGRYVQVGIKAQVWQRDKGKCTSCGSNYALEIDHRKPYSLGGKTLPENLRLLCRNCNQRKSYEVFGGLKTLKQP